MQRDLATMSSFVPNTTLIAGAHHQGDSSTSSGSGSEVALIRESIWNGCVPCEFTLSKDEVVALEGPRPLYLMLPRSSYLPFVTEKITTFFDPFILRPQPERSDSSETQSAEKAVMSASGTSLDENKILANIWYEYHGKPLKVSLY